MAEDTKEEQKIQYAPEMKVIPPPNPSIRYPDVAAIPPGQKSVVILPKEKEVETDKPQELVIRHDVVQGEPTPK